MRFAFIWLLFAFGMLACSHKPDHGELEERFARHFQDSMCGITLRKTHDFLAWRDIPGPLTGAMVRERCSGAWKIIPSEESWWMVFSQGELVDMSDGICSDSFEIWNPVSGYLNTSDSVFIRHPITGTLLCSPLEE